MAAFRDLSIRSKLKAIILLTSTVAVALASTAFVSYDFYTFRRAKAQRLATLADIIGTQSTAALTFNDPKAGQEILKALAAEKRVVYACIYKKDGRIFVKYLRGGTGADFSPPVPEPEGTRFVDDGLILFRPILLDGEPIGTLCLQMDLADIHERVSGYWAGVAFVVLVCLLVASLLSSRLQRSISEPIQGLSETTRMVSVRKDYSIRAVQQSNDEVGHLIAGFNEMLEQIERRETALRRTHDQLEERTQELEGEITERQRVQEKLQEILLLQRAILDAANYSIISVSPDGTIRTFNAAAQRWLGYAAEEMVGQARLEILHDPQEVAQHAGELAQELGLPVELGFAALVARAQRGAPDEQEWTYIRKDGSRFPVLLSMTALLDRQGEITGYLGIASDTTERKHLEQQLRQSQKMEAVGRLAGGIAHDFNNLLGVIIGYCELLLMDSENCAGPLAKKVEEIEKAGQRAASLTRQLLAFSRKQVIKPAVLNLNSVVGDLDKMLRRLIGEDIDLAVLRGSGLGCAKADRSQIEQVIMNLVVNARDAMSKGGKLIIETRNVDLDEGYAQRHWPVRPGRYVMLAVTDTGTGMDEETQAHVFEPFFTTKEAGKGTGLGLATVFGIVKQSSGYIWVYSEPGLGSTFKIFLPRVDLPDDLGAPRARLAESLHGSETILLVEDAEAFRTLTREFLTTMGYAVLEARDGEEAIQIARQNGDPIHLLLTDVVMPKISGRELAERMKNLRPETKLIYMSGYTEDTVILHGVSHGTGALLQKPFTFEELSRKLREILDAPTLKQTPQRS